MSKKGGGGGRTYSSSSGSSRSYNRPSQRASPPRQRPAKEKEIYIIEKRRQPGLFGQMAATAAGVAVGSSVGHAVGETLVGGKSSKDEPGPCSREIQQFVNCADKSNDISDCQGYNEAIKECKQRNGLK